MHRVLPGFAVLLLVTIAGCTSGGREDDAGPLDDIDSCPTKGNNEQVNGDSIVDACATCGLVFLVGELSPGQVPGPPSYLTALNDKLYFSADDASERNNGRELWIPEPATGATTLIDLAPGGDSSLPNRQNMVSPDGQLYFDADDGVHGKEPWTYSPATGASALGAITPGSDNLSQTYEFTTLNSKLYFWARDENNEIWLWQYDRNLGLSEIFYHQSTHSLSARHLTAFNGMLYFSQETLVYGNELWRYDPKNPIAGATLVAEIYPGRISGNPAG